MASVARPLTEAPPAVVRIAGLRRSFDGRTVLDGVDLEIGSGEFVALLGRSGSGKSTILRAVAGLDPEVEGRIEVPGRRSVLFQDSRLLPWMRVLDNVMLGLVETDTRGRARRALAEVGLADKADVWPKTLSGGEQQRVALARSLVRDPELLLADEPFSALDALTRLRMHGLLQKLRRRHAPAVLFVTHDVEEALRLADRVAITANGRVSFDRPVGSARSSPERFDALRRDILDRLGVPSD